MPRPRTESPTSTKYTWAISNPKCCSYVTSGPPVVSTFVDLRFVPHTSKTQSGSSAVAGHVSEPRDVVSDLNFAEKQNFLHWGWMASGDQPLSQTTVILVITITLWGESEHRWFQPSFFHSVEHSCDVTWPLSLHCDCLMSNLHNRLSLFNRTILTCAFSSVSDTSSA